MTDAMIEVRDLRKEFGSTRAVDGISFSVSRGQVVGFLGPNGAGKSTTMKILTGYIAATDGGAFIGGQDVREHSLATRERIGYLPESAPLYDEMMVVEFLDFAAQVRRIPKDKRSKRLKEVVDRCGLGDVLGKDIGQLSKGFRQRVGLAQSIVHNPDVLVLDEPTSGLDPNQIVEIRDLILDLGREKTVILSTHILPEVQATCGRVIIINAGKLVADDSTEALTRTGGAGRLTVTYAPADGVPLEAARVRALVEALPGVHGVNGREAEHGTVGFTVTYGGHDDPRRSLFDLAVHHQMVLVELHREQVSLEDTFRKLTAGPSRTH